MKPDCIQNASKSGFVKPDCNQNASKSGFVKPDEPDSGFTSDLASLNFNDFVVP